VYFRWFKIGPKVVKKASIPKGRSPAHLRPPIKRGHVQHRKRLWVLQVKEVFDEEEQGERRRQGRSWRRRCWHKAFSTCKKWGTKRTARNAGRSRPKQRERGGARVISAKPQEGQDLEGESKGCRNEQKRGQLVSWGRPSEAGSKGEKNGEVRWRWRGRGDPGDRYTSRPWRRSSEGTNFCEESSVKRTGGEARRPGGGSSGCQSEPSSRGGAGHSIKGENKSYNYRRLGL